MAEAALYRRRPGGARGCRRQHFCPLTGTDASAAPVVTGSHIDAIPNAGRSIELGMFTAEEPTRFGLGCLGSRLMAGTLSRSKIESLRDPQGLSVDDVCAQAYKHGTLESTRLTPGCYDSFVELHIEQGPLLEQKKIPIGVVTAIAAPAALRIDLSGPGGHAGTVLMPDRHDPSLAAAEIMQAVERAALATQSRDTVATCGLVQVLPGAVNSIPREVRLEIDVSDIDGARRDGVLAAIRTAAKAAAERRGCGFKEQLTNADPPATCAPHIVTAVEQAAAAVGLPCQRMIAAPTTTRCSWPRSAPRR